MPFDPGDPAADLRVFELRRQRVSAGRGQGEYVAWYRPGVPGALGGEDWGAARRAVRAAVPDELFGLPFDDIEQEEVGGGVWRATVIYGVPGGQPTSSDAPYGFGTPAGPFPPLASGGGVPAAPPAPPAPPAAGGPLGPEWSFDTTGSTVKVTQSLDTPFTGRRDDDFSAAGPPDFKRAVGVTKEGVEGTDIASRKLEFTYQVRAAYITLGYTQQLYRLTGTVNAAPFLGFAAGELLFLGVCAQSAAPTDGKTPAWTLSFKFAASPTKGDPFGAVVAPADSFVVAGNPDTAVPDPGRILVPGKKGWDYVWVSYGQKTDGGRTVQVPQYAYVEQVYPFGDFTLLALFS